MLVVLEFFHEAPDFNLMPGLPLTLLDTMVSHTRAQYGSLTAAQVARAELGVSRHESSDDVPRMDFPNPRSFIFAPIRSLCAFSTVTTNRQPSIDCSTNG